MIIGVPKEIKDNEYRVGMVPYGVKALTGKGHTVLIEEDAGLGSAIANAEFKDAGAELLNSAEELYSRAELIVKVKEPIECEYKYFREDLSIFTFLHLAAKKELAEALISSGITAIAYETVTDKSNVLPILKPMSEVAGKLSTQVGAHYLLKQNKGRGVLLGGVPGVAHGHVCVLGVGTVGLNAIQIAIGLGAEVTVLDIDTEKFRHLDELYGTKVNTLHSNPMSIEETVKEADLVIGAVHIPGARTTTLVTEELVKKMKKGSVIIDVSVDQGGCIETTRPTTHTEPTFILHDVIHYGVTNMPGSVPRTSTFALTNATLPYIQKMAENGTLEACLSTKELKNGINISGGKVTHPEVAESLGLTPGEL